MPKASRNLAQTVVEELTGRISQNLLKPGVKLPTESALTVEFGVSRTVIREAMSRLQAAEMVETRHGIGTFVRADAARARFRIDLVESATLQEVIAIMELRMSVESEAAALAAERRTSAQIAKMRRALEAFQRQTARSESAVGADFKFHLTIAQATGNHHFVDLISYLGTLLFPRSKVNTAQLAGKSRGAYLRDVNLEHAQVVEAIVRGDADAARCAMRQHLGNSCDRLRDANRLLARSAVIGS